MIDGIEDEPPPKPPTIVETDRPMVRVSMGFFNYLQECADLVSAISTDDRPLTRYRAIEWRIAARAIQISHGKIEP